MFGFFTNTNGNNGMIRAPSIKLKASSTTLLYLGSAKLCKKQTTSVKSQAASVKRQAFSIKLQDP
jgi:hypothetical protein